VVIGASETSADALSGERIGGGDGPELDVALDPLEGSDIVAQGRANAMAVVAISEKGALFRAPDTCMEKIAVGPRAKGAVDLSQSPARTWRHLKAKKCCRGSDRGDPGPPRPRRLVRSVRRRRASS
jgi:fructose-1,6-bisphosphatase II